MIKASEGTGKESFTIMCLERMNDTSVKWLNVSGKVGLKEFKMDVGENVIAYFMTRKVVK
jgi:hypothetical protein